MTVLQTPTLMRTTESAGPALQSTISVSPVNTILSILKEIVLLVQALFLLRTDETVIVEILEIHVPNVMRALAKHVKETSYHQQEGALLQLQTVPHTIQQMEPAQLANLDQ